MPSASTEPGPRIRPFGETDRAALIRLWRDCDLTRPWNDPDADIDRAVANPTSAILIAEVDGRLNGSVMCGYDGHRGWVYYLAVTTDARKSGSGRLLMTAAENWLRDRGCPKIELMVRDTNDGVIRFYEALDYEHQPVKVLARWLIEPEGGSPTGNPGKR